MLKLSQIRSLYILPNGSLVYQVIHRVVYYRAAVAYHSFSDTTALSIAFGNQGQKLPLVSISLSYATALTNQCHPSVTDMVLDIKLAAAEDVGRMVPTTIQTVNISWVISAFLALYFGFTSFILSL